MRPVLSRGGVGVTVFNSPLQDVDNAGLIQSMEVLGNAYNAITAAGSLNNSGTLFTAAGSTVVVFANTTIDEIINSGTIEGMISGTDAIILAKTNSSSPVGLINSGFITNLSGLGSAINLSAASTFKYTQNAGQVTGNVILSKTGGDVFDMNGGIIIGNVTAVGVAPDILDLNGGFIQGTTQLGNNGDTVNLTLSFIQALNGGAGADTINITGGSFTSINGGAGDIVNINDTFTANGTINNVPLITVNNAGTIFTLNKAVTGLSNQLLINNNTSTIINSTVSGTGRINLQNNASLQVNSGGTVSLDNGVDVLGTLASINNAGTIQTTTESTIVLDPGATVTTITNSGTLQATAIVNPANSVILASGNNTAGNIINTGNITNVSGIGTAIDLQTGGNILIGLTQSAGTITGNVLLSANGGNALTMNGGTINGTVTTGAASTLNLNGGTITQPVNLAAAGNTVNIAGGNYNNLNSKIGNDIFNITGGNFAAINGKPGDVVNINATYTLTDIISNVPTINVNNAGTVFTVNKAITGLSNSLVVNAGTTLIPNADILGTGNITIQNGGTMQVNNNPINTVDIINSGRLNLSSTALLKVDSLTQTYTGDLGIVIQDAQYSKIQSSGPVNLAAGSTITVNATITGFTGATFDIVQAPAGSITDFSTLRVSPSRLTFTFVKSGPFGNPCGAFSCIQLIAERVPFAVIGQTGNASAVGATLDNLAASYPNINPELRVLLEQLNLLNTAGEMTDALESLAPSFNNSLVASSHIIMDNAFDTAQQRIEELHGIRSVYEEILKGKRQAILNGANFGDLTQIFGGRGKAGLWGKIYGNELKQQRRHGVNGFRTNAYGLAMGYDWRVNPCFTFGFAGSYDHAKTADRSPLRNTIHTNSYQGTAYGWYEPKESWYIDSMLGIASHQYHTERHIAIGTLFTSPSADFNSLHYGAQLDVGYDILTGLMGNLLSDSLQQNDDFYILPVFRMKYTYLDFRSYSETGAGGIGLSVDYNSVDEAILGIGFRAAMKMNYGCAVLVPEISSFLLYDFSGKALNSQAEFLGGGQPFYITGVDPAQRIFLFGAALNTHFSRHTFMTIKYGLEARNRFYGNNGYMQLFYTWD